MLQKEGSCRIGTVVTASSSSGLLRLWGEAIGAVADTHEARDRSGLETAMKTRSSAAAVIDLALPGLDGAIGIHRLHKAYPGTRILVACALDGNAVLAALKAGARGCYDRDAGMALLPKALRAILRGEIWIERRFTQVLLSELLKLAKESGSDDSGVPQLLDNLTPRERQVASLIGEGLCQKSIAAQLAISDNTVRNHLRNIFKKLGVSDRLKLALIMWSETKGQSFLGGEG